MSTITGLPCLKTIPQVPFLYFTWMNVLFTIAHNKAEIHRTRPSAPGMSDPIIKDQLIVEPVE